jgi:hypothetical protein
MSERKGIIVMHRGDEVSIFGRKLEMVEFTHTVPLGGANDDGSLRIRLPDNRQRSPPVPIPGLVGKLGRWFV